ncbi:MAG: type II toxin-antitoxin system VapB family antitoxin [Candidatus Sumerlaeota bacterium]|nr:type II toxin-antitoxin system VapB family antitoxin [Candidatus Sumerlaeota bacterium]
MRATITIQDDAMKDLARFTKGRTKTAAVNYAIRDWVRLKKMQEIKSLCGKIDIADDLETLRALETLEG